MSNISLGTESFFWRMQKLYVAWKNAANGKSDESFAKVDCLVFCVGVNKDTLYSKSSALQTWLFGNELPDTITVLSENSICFLGNKKIIEFLQPIDNKRDESTSPTVKFLIRDKNDKDKENYNKLIQEIQMSKSGKTLGVFAKDVYPGEFCESWKSATKAENFENIDISSPIALLMAPKEDSEVISVKKACMLTVDVFTKYLKNQIKEIIDSDKKVKHSKLAEGVEAEISDKKYITEVDTSQVDMCYPPIIQSGGKYSLSFNAVSDENYLHFGAIICSLGARYKSYCSNITRTLLVNPSDDIKSNYNFLLNLEDEIMRHLVAGAKLSSVYEAGMALAKKEKPDLVDNLTKIFGFAMGIEFQESSIVIGPKTSIVAKKGMVFNINVGLANLTNSAAKDQEGKTYALFIGDTVLVNEEQPASLLTQSDKKIEHIGIFLKDDNNKENTTEIHEADKMEDLVKQDTLVLSQSKENPKLDDVCIRPDIEAQKMSGLLEAHTNGFRFTSVGGDIVDILYNNIKKAFYQPCEGESIILLHFHLKHAVFLGKKKYVDIQFYTEIGNEQSDFSSKLELTFKSFCDDVATITKQEIKFDTPLRELGFLGAPFRGTVLLQPTSGALVNLTDWPPFVIVLEDVELVHFERPQEYLRNFDMVFIFKDYVEKVAMVNAIPLYMLDHVKIWLNSCDIRCTEGVNSLNWTNILKIVTDDRKGFFDNGGWSFLDAESDNEQSEEEQANESMNTVSSMKKEFDDDSDASEGDSEEFHMRGKKGLFKQDPLVLSQSKENPKLEDLYIRANIDTNRMSGSLEAHTNGFRFTPVRGDKVDILYNNIKYAFYQCCDGEMIILLHFHLKHEIMLGRRKHVNIQFYTEMGEHSRDMYDNLPAEQCELRNNLELAFKSFCEGVATNTKQEIKFDTPLRELGFPGAPFRSSILLEPTSGALVNLTDWPPFVISLEDVEFVHFERVHVFLKNFDMVFIYKDYAKEVAMVNAVPLNMLDHVKKWLNSCGIRYTEGVYSLNWTEIMKIITNDRKEFFDNGGWSFLDPESESENNEQNKEQGVTTKEDCL